MDDEPPDRESELPEEEEDVDPLDEPSPPPLGAADPTVEPVLGREPACGAAHEGTALSAKAVATAPIVNA